MWCLLLAGCAEEKLTAPADASTTPVKVEVRVDSIADYMDGELPATRALSEGMYLRVIVTQSEGGAYLTYADYNYTASGGLVPINGGIGLVLPGKRTYSFFAYSYNRANFQFAVDPWNFAVPVTRGDDFLAYTQRGVWVDKHAVLNIRLKHLMSRVRVAVQAQQEIEQCTGKLMNLPATCVWGVGMGGLSGAAGNANVDLKFSGRGTTVVSDPVLLIPSGGVRTLQVDFPLIVTGGQRYTNASGVFRGVNWLPGTDHLYELRVVK